MELQRLLSLTRKAIDDFHQITDGDSIAVGISGGKDSLTLLCALNGLKRFYPADFELIPICVDLGFSDKDPAAFGALRRFTADMAVQNVIGDGFRGATWVSIHNGGGVGWGEVINGGFGMVIDGSEDSARHIREMLFWDVNNGIARRSWARNEGARFAIEREMARTPGLKVTLPNLADENLIKKALQ